MSTAKDKMLWLDRRTTTLFRLHKGKPRMPIRQPHQRHPNPLKSFPPPATTPITPHVARPRRGSKLSSVVTHHAIPVLPHLCPDQLDRRRQQTNHSRLPSVRPAPIATESIRFVAAVCFESVDSESSGRRLCRHGVPSSPRSAD